MILLDLKDAAEHARAIKQIERLESQAATKRSFDGAAVNRLTSDWIAASTTTRSELRRDLRRLRARSRDLAHNDPFFKKFLGTLKTNVVGPHGIKLQVRARAGGDPTGTLNQTLNTKLEAAFNQWSKKKTCTASGKLTWRDAQRLFISTLARDGEVMVRKHWVRKTKANPFGFTLQFVDVNWLDETHNALLPGGNRIVMGVEVDKLDRPQAYWLTPPTDEYTYPGAMAGGGAAGRQRTRVPADEIIHAFLANDENQTRGLPWPHAAMIRVKMLNGYEEAELVAARGGACKAGFLKPPEDQSYDGQQKQVVESVEPGMIQELPPGYEFVDYDPNHPNTNYGGYVRNVLMGIAAGLELSYATLTGDLSQANFASARLGHLEERDVWRTLQQFVIDHFCCEVYDAWLDAAYLTGALDLSEEEYAAVAEPVWQPRGWTWVDPVRDVQASILAVNNALATRTDVLAEQGEDFEETVAVLAQEQATLKQHGIEIVSQQPQAPAKTDPPED